MKIFINAGLGLSLLFIAMTTVSAGTALEKATFAGGCFWCMEPP